MVLKKKVKLGNGLEIEVERARFDVVADPWSEYVVELPDGRAARVRFRTIVTDMWVAKETNPDGSPIVHTEAQNVLKAELMDPDERPPRVTR